MCSMRFVVEIIPYDPDIRYYKVYRFDEPMLEALNEGYGAIYTSYTTCHSYDGGYFTTSEDSLLLCIL